VHIISFRHRAAAVAWRGGWRSGILPCGPSVQAAEGFDVSIGTARRLIWEKHNGDDLGPLAPALIRTRWPQLGVSARSCSTWPARRRATSDAASLVSRCSVTPNVRPLHGHLGQGKWCFDRPRDECSRTEEVRGPDHACLEQTEARSPRLGGGITGGEIDTLS
jgi:hypothetical protein